MEFLSSLIIEKLKKHPPKSENFRHAKRNRERIYGSQGEHCPQGIQDSLQPMLTGTARRHSTHLPAENLGG